VKNKNNTFVECHNVEASEADVYESYGQH